MVAGLKETGTIFPGRWVFHCHILQHEDFGMMGTVKALA